jgi:DNA-binding SARP family transcriptional activator/predicted ATPase
VSPILGIRLLGEFSLIYDGAPVQAFTRHRLRSLLAYLVLHRDAPQSRPRLAYWFWPDVSEEQARSDLRQLWHQLRHTLPDADRFLHSDTATVRWRADASFRLDVADFEHALARADAADRLNDRGAQRTALAEAVDLYRADLLPSCYDDWIAPARERLRQCHLRALTALVRLLEAQRDYGGAIRYARNWIQHDPLAEDSYRTLMRLLALTDDRAGALRVFQMCAANLQHELGVEPDAATRDVYERIFSLESARPPTAARDRAPATMPAFVGRRREWAQLHAAWQRAGTEGPCFVLVTGEAGIGKSRLAEELLAWAGRQGMAIAKTRSYAAEGQLSFAPVTDWLRSDGIRPHIEHLDSVWLTEVSRILPELLVEHPDLPQPEPLTEYGQRQRFFETLARTMLAAPQPLMLLIDDLQWCDQETLEWLHFLLRFDPAARLLVVGTVRADELSSHHPLHTLLLHLANTVGAVEMALQPLDAAETSALAAQVAGRALDSAAALRLYQETDGIPLFVVETVRARIEAAHTPERNGIPLAIQVAGDRSSLPPRVYGVIAGRLARLSAPARELSGLAAAIGRAFTLDLLLGAGDDDAGSVVRALDELWTRRIIRDQGANSYDFTHDRLREVAYAEAGAAQRRLFHRRIARTFESANAGDLDPMSGQIAAHYERAGMDEHAIPHYQRAAAVAQRVYANDEAIGLLSRGLALLEGLPAGMRRDTQELGLLLALAPTVRVAKGWTAPEAEHLLDRALALCDKGGDDGRRAQVLNGLQSVYIVQARFARVQQLAGELETLYQRSGGTMPPLYTRVMLNAARFHLGHVAEANDGFAAIGAVPDPDQMQRLQVAHGANYMVQVRYYQGHALWYLGYPESALARGHEAVQIARDLEQPFNQAMAAVYLAQLVQLCADDATARTYAEEALVLASEYKAPYYRLWSAILVSYARAWERPDRTLICRLRDAITAFTAAGARLRLPYFLSLLARVCLRAGCADDGMGAIDEALAVSRTQNERWWDAELHRLRGELLLAHGASARDAEMALLRAGEIARLQQARSLELRAVISLARLWATRQRAAEARRVLGDLCAWFTEGHTTPDMLAAQTLLAQLAQAATA